jgi:hypothetical protein
MTRSVPASVLQVVALVAVVLVTLLAPLPAAAAPEGQLTWAFHVSLAPTPS